MCLAILDAEREAAFGQLLSLGGVLQFSVKRTASNPFLPRHSCNAWVAEDGVLAIRNATHKGWALGDKRVRDTLARRCRPLAPDARIDA